VRQCENYSTSEQARCCYAEGHSGEHYFSNQDESDRIRWKLAADERDSHTATIDRLEREVAEAKQDAKDTGAIVRESIVAYLRKKATVRVACGNALLSVADDIESDDAISVAIRAERDTLRARVEELEQARHDALDEVASERNLLRSKLEEISELFGPGGDNTPFGRAESALAALVAHAEHWQRKAAVAERQRDEAREECERMREICREVVRRGNLIHDNLHEQKLLVGEGIHEFLHYCIGASMDGWNSGPRSALTAEGKGDADVPR
jgi:chromosome segregation ATPase